MEVTRQNEISERTNLLTNKESNLSFQKAQSHHESIINPSLSLGLEGVCSGDSLTNSSLISAKRQTQREERDEKNGFNKKIQERKTKKMKESISTEDDQSQSQKKHLDISKQHDEAW